MNNRRDFIKNTVMAGIGVTVLGKEGVIGNEQEKLKDIPGEDTIKSPAVTEPQRGDINIAG